VSAIEQQLDTASRMEDCPACEGAKGDSLQQLAFLERTPQSIVATEFHLERANSCFQEIAATLALTVPSMLKKISPEWPECKCIGPSHAACNLVAVQSPDHGRHKEPLHEFFFLCGATRLELARWASPRVVL
jgi:hypothetical protein